ncbi:MAG: dihydrolipoyl dehydrogenase [Gammaproteobacteria bacterium]|nr:dihydrolipoyl dehydrogenase [Gammaproteobacteria bacterium]
MSKKYNVVVVGAGPAGYVAAIRCAQLGMSVACVDEWHNAQGESSLGGTCLNVGCIPSKALLESSHLFAMAQNEFKDHGISVTKLRIDVPIMMARKDKVVTELTQGIKALFKANKVEFFHGHARLAQGKKVEVRERGGKKIIDTLEADNIILAAGSSSVHLDQAPLDQQYIVDSTGALEFDAVPKRLGIIGAGAIGLELASVWSRLGSEVVLIEAMDEFLSIADQQISRAAFRSYKKQGMDIRINARLLSATVKNKQVQVTYEDNRGAQQVVFDKLIVAVGRKPNSDTMFGDEMELVIDERSFIHVNKYCETSVPGIYAIGDIVRGPMLAHKGSEEGMMVAERIAGQASSVNYDLIPSVIYTQPEIAWVGKTEQACEAEGVPVNIGIFPMTASGRARAMAASEGMVKIIAHKETDRVLGVHIFSAQASELIAQAVMAMEMGASAEDIALTVFAHPTLAEAIHEAALAVDMRAIHIKN